jgi:quinol monooxygenase YgiN
MTGLYQLAHLNIARMKFDMESPRMKGFVDALDDVNATADASPGFVWRLQDDDDAPEALIWDDPSWLVNISVWEDVDALKAFIRTEGHMAVMKRRREWFSATTEAYVVLWWVPTGHIPTVAEAQARLEKLRVDGPGPEAFSFARPFPAT